MTTPTRITRSLLLALMGFALLSPNTADAARKSKRRAPMTEEAKIEYKANSLIGKAEELLTQQQEERGIKMLQSVGRLYPKSKARFTANLVMGRHFAKKRDYELAIKQFSAATESENPEEQAEAQYQAGICNFQLNDFDKAFTTFRRVTSDFPGSVYANEAYYYIGLCHFKQERWSRAVESLKRVGTSVSPDENLATLSEAGQRMFIQVEDKDLIVLLGDKATVDVNVETENGDKEVVALEVLGRSGTHYIGSIPTAPGSPEPGNNILEIQGGSKAKVSYVDANTGGGDRNVEVLANITMVSTASVGFTDGAFREYTEGVFANQPFFVRVKDIDRDTSDQKDSLTAQITIQYKVEKEEDVEKTGIVFEEDEEDEFAVRSETEITLTETGPHTGIFVGGGEVLEASAIEAITTAITTEVALEPADPVEPVEESIAASTTSENLIAKQGDVIILSYLDQNHIGGRDPEEREYEAKMLVGEIQDVRIEHREVDTEDLKARKNLIEAKIYLKLAQVFKDVGLQAKADVKADQGLDLVESVIRLAFKAGLEQKLIEESFNVKWELLMAKNQLGQAIGVCNQLVRLYPNSSLVDRALLKIATAQMKSEEREDRNKARQIFGSILRLKKSELKAEAQYRIGELQEQEATEAWERSQKRSPLPNMGAALTSYKSCVDNYPDSSYAGEALDKISTYYIKVKDYRRAIELMEQVFTDYPDAGFLDTMLYKWAIASYRLGNYPQAKDKADRLLFDYPNSKHAETMRKILSAIERKL